MQDYSSKYDQQAEKDARMHCSCFCSVADSDISDKPCVKDAVFRDDRLLILSAS
jgi:hypothetical protein